MKRGSWLPVLMGVTVFVVLGGTWLDFLETDQCVDLGGIIENGTCVGSRHPVASFYEWPWVYKLLVILPPLLIAGFAAIVTSSLIKLGDRDA